MGGGGSSGVHAMDGQSGDGAREGETLGKGGSHPESEALGTGGSHPESKTLGKGGSDAHSDNSDDPIPLTPFDRRSRDEHRNPNLALDMALMLAIALLCIAAAFILLVCVRRDRQR